VKGCFGGGSVTSKRGGSASRRLRRLRKGIDGLRPTRLLPSTTGDPVTKSYFPRLTVSRDAARAHNL